MAKMEADKVRTPLLYPHSFLKCFETNLSNCLQETARAAAATAYIEEAVVTAMAAFENARVQAAAELAQAEERVTAAADGGNLDTVLAEVRASVVAELQAELVNALAQQAEEAVSRETMQVHVTFNIQVRVQLAAVFDCL
jgi:hypothetical protein